MLRRWTMAVLGLFLLSGVTLAVDRTVTGKLVEVDIEDKAVTIKSDAGKTVEFVIGDKSVVTDSKGKSNFGFKDARLKPGASVKVVLPEKGNTIKELHQIAAAAADSSTSRDKLKGTTKTQGDTNQVNKQSGGITSSGVQKTPPSQDKSSTGTSKSDDSTKTTRGSTSKVEKKKDDSKDTHDAEKGIAYKITRIDKAKRSFTGEAVEGGKTATFTLDEKVEFVGPRGGVSDDDFDDDRFVVGDIVQVEMDKAGKTVSKVHLPYRKRISKQSPPNPMQVCESTRRLVRS